MWDRWILSKVVRSPPQSLLDITRSNCNAFLHLSFIYMMCGIKLSFLSKKRQRNLTCSSTGSCCPYSLRLGSGCKPFLLQKCIHKIFVGENLKPFSSAQVTNLSRQPCRRRSIIAILLDCSPVVSLWYPEIVGTIRFFGGFVLIRYCRCQIQLLPVWQLWGESVICINPKWPPSK